MTLLQLFGGDINKLLRYNFWSCLHDRLMKLFFLPICKVPGANVHSQVEKTWNSKSFFTFDKLPIRIFTEFDDIVDYAFYCFQVDLVRFKGRKNTKAYHF